MSNSLKQRLGKGDTITGIFCSTPAPLMIELIAAADFDFVIIDLEHTLIEGQQLEAMILAARSNGLSVLVRLPENALYRSVQLLDAGAEGLVFPRVSTVQQAEQAVYQCRYGTRGARGLNSTRDNHYGRDNLADYVSEANSQLLLIMMIEDRTGVQAADQIAAVDGVDMLLPGAADLSQSFNFPWQTSHPEVQAAIEQIHTICQRRQKGFCALPRNQQEQQAWLEQGVQCFVAGDDRGICRRALTAVVNDFKEMVKKHV
ncbi:HpcH/HpaI aldolase/citrate lyase family protein [Motiliproteus sp. MSK22-1]|uniref:HpcH/HpaI aldolase family protein n=1 Tax=Motiliproteus sp. MSK22-1 TaxID=1897630 RepID=UPI000976998D|nr:aldolase/citrate lyase family protein [Motiliproteus sp. MSK22-1]OMH33821.1 hypothetical protein BGP75_12595 [Motiliproteus sp. MSK22-1]